MSKTKPVFAWHFLKAFWKKLIRSFHDLTNAISFKLLKLVKRTGKLAQSQLRLELGRAHFLGDRVKLELDISSFGLNRVTIKPKNLPLGKNQNQGKILLGPPSTQYSFRWVQVNFLETIWTIFFHFLQMDRWMLPTVPSAFPTCPGVTVCKDIRFI